MKAKVYFEFSPFRFFRRKILVFVFFWYARHELILMGASP